jgi:hypothetical protein
MPSAGDFSAPHLMIVNPRANRSVEFSPLPRHIRWRLSPRWN